MRPEIIPVLDIDAPDKRTRYRAEPKESYSVNLFERSSSGDWNLIGEFSDHDLYRIALFARQRFNATHQEVVTFSLMGDELARARGQKDSAPAPPPEATAALATMAYLIRDAARKYADSKLQNDSEELDRLLGIFNVMPEDIIPRVRAEIERREPVDGTVLPHS